MEEKTSSKEAKTGKDSSIKGLDFIIAGSIALIFFLCPLFFTGIVAQGIGFEKMVLFYFLVLLGVVAWVTKGVVKGELDIKRTPLDLPLLIFFIIYGIASGFSISVKDSLIGSYGNSAKGLVALIIFILFYYLVVNNLNAKRIRLFLMALVSSAALIVIYTLLQLSNHFVLPFDFARAQSFNPLGSLTGLTTFLIIILPLLVVTVAQAKEIFPKLSQGAVYAIKIVFGLITAGSLVILALLNGFTFWPIAVVGIVIVLMFFLAKIIKISTNNLLIPLAVFLLLIILLVLGNFNIATMNLPSEVSLSRGASWQIAKASIKESPLLGSGPSTYYYDFSKFRDIQFNASPLWNASFESASGVVFELIATIGIIGAIVFIIMMLIALSVSFLTIIKGENKEVDSILLGLFASFVCTSLYLLLFAQSNSMLLICAIISILAIAAALVMYPEKFKTIKLSFRSSAKYALALSAIFLCVSAGVVILFTMGLKMYLADKYAKASLMAGDLNVKIQDLDKAIELAPYQDVYYINNANNYMALANQAVTSGKNQADINNILAKAIDLGKKAVDLAPNRSSNNELLALVYENASFFTKGALDWAEKSYLKEIELDPNNPTPNFRLGLINMVRSNSETDPEEKKNDLNEAIKRYEEAITKKGDLAAAYYGESIANEKLGNVDKSIEELTKANLSAGDNLDYRFELGRLYFNRGVSQPNLNQTASQQIAENQINGANASSSDAVSVQPNLPTGATVTRNNDLNVAEQLFLSILTVNQNYANARYSLAVLYQKIGERDKAKIMAQSLINILQDEATKNAVKEQFKDLL
jgi:Flp pilus assembly protein TadD